MGEIGFPGDEKRAEVLEPVSKLRSLTLDLFKQSEEKIKKLEA